MARFAFRNFAYASVAVAALVAASPVCAQTRTFNVPAQDASKAIPEFARQAGVQIFASRTDGVRTNEVKGSMDVQAALRKLIAGTDLEVASIKENVIVLRSVSTPQGNALAGGPNAGSETTDSYGEEPVPEKQEGISEILVVGSRSRNVDIRRTEDDPQPYVVFEGKQIEQSTATNVEDFLQKRLSSATNFRLNSQISISSNNASTSSINLRGLGTDRTLVLIDGRRAAGSNFNGEFGQVDLNAIPIAQIDRIEVLPLSGSAIYGGAAMGGVINVILKHDYNGGTVRYNFDAAESSHYRHHDLAANYGFTLFGGNTRVMLSGGYTHSTPLLFGDRIDVFNRGIGIALRNFPNQVVNPLGSAYPGAAPNIASSISSQNLTLKPAYGGGALNSRRTWISLGTAPGAVTSADLLAHAGQQNLASPDIVNSGNNQGLRTPLGSTPTTWSLGLSVRQKLFDNVELTAEFSHRDNNAESKRNVFNQTPWTVTAAAPTNPFNQSVTINSPVDFDRPVRMNTSVNSGSIGLIAPLFSNWKSSLDYTFSRSKTDLSAPARDSAALSAALLSGALNPFADLLKYPVDLSPYTATQTSKGHSNLHDAVARAAGTLFRLPGGPVNLTVGGGFRREAIDRYVITTVNATTHSADMSFIIMPNSQDTTSLYAELDTPVFSEENRIPLLAALELQLAARSEWFANTFYSPSIKLPAATAEPERLSTRFNSVNPTFGVKYDPIAGLSLRASYSTGFLPPTPTQLTPYANGSCFCLTIFDPKNGQTYTVTNKFGGNLDLKPTRSKSISAGIVIEPRADFLKGFRLSVDYYDIKQPNLIISSPIAATLLADEANFSTRIVRDPVTGLVTSIDTSAINAIKSRTRGIDLALDYNRHTTFGDLGAHVKATHVISAKQQQSIGGDYLEYAGFPSDGGPIENRGSLVLDWNLKGWSASWLTSYYGPYKQQFSKDDPLFGYNPNSSVLLAQGDDRIPSQVYHDLAIAYTFGDGNSFMGGALNRTSLNFSIRNIFNSMPPYDVLTPGSCYCSAIGDLKMRTFRIGLRKNF